MLKVLYKILSRILSKRLTETLPTIIGEHQHGFMKGRSIQEPILLASHLIQDAQENKKPLQLISYDLEKGFDRTSHKIIEDALRLLTRTIFLIKTGSGQGDPISSILFLISTEPLNRAIVHRSEAIMYKTINNLTVGAFFCC